MIFNSIELLFAVELIINNTTTEGRPQWPRG